MTRTKATKTTTAKRTGKPRILVVGSSGGGSINDAGGVAAFVPVGDLRALEAIEHENIHGLLLTGGGDVDPGLYGAQRDRTVYGLSEDRDLVELELVAKAKARGIPVLGICRGAQIINVANGGTLWLDIQRDAQAHNFHHGHDHRVTTVRGSRVAKAMQVPEPWVVSIHHQAVRDVAPGFVATAFSSDGIVEAIESVEGWTVGVQFHPEIGRRPSDQRIFDRFVYACGARVGLRPKAKALHAAPITRKSEPVDTGSNAGAWWDRQEWTEVNAPRATVARSERAAHRRSGPVNVSWRCFKGCGIRFDEQMDYEDHMVLLHGESRATVKARA